MDLAIHNPLPAAFLAARRPLIVAAARKVFQSPGFFWDMPEPVQAPTPKDPKGRFTPGRVPSNKLDLTPEERAERVKAQKRAWREAHRSGRKPGRPRKVVAG